jgi:hypothetical protein
LKDKTIWFSAIFEKQPKSLWGSGEGITVDKTEKCFLMEVSNLIIKKNTWSDWQEKDQEERIYP